MKKYWVDFTASLLIDAENEEDAKTKATEKIPDYMEFIHILKPEIAEDEKN